MNRPFTGDPLSQFLTDAYDPENPQGVGTYKALKKYIEQNKSDFIDTGYPKYTLNEAPWTYLLLPSILPKTNRSNAKIVKNRDRGPFRVEYSHLVYEDDDSNHLDKSYSLDRRVIIEKILKLLDEIIRSGGRNSGGEAKALNEIFGKASDLSLSKEGMEAFLSLTISLLAPLRALTSDEFCKFIAPYLKDASSDVMSKIQDEFQKALQLDPTPKYTFRRYPNRRVWNIRFETCGFPIEDKKGLTIIYQLFLLPGRAIHSDVLFNLESASGGADHLGHTVDYEVKTEKIAGKSYGPELAYDAAYIKSQLDALEQQIEEARERSDYALAEKLEDDRCKLRAFVKKNSNKKGQPRVFGNKSHRTAVTNSIREVRKIIKKNDENLEQHLKKFIRGGEEFIYSPYPPVVWNL